MEHDGGEQPSESDVSGFEEKIDLSLQVGLAQLCACPEEEMGFLSNL